MGPSERQRLGRSYFMRTPCQEELAHHIGREPAASQVWMQTSELILPNDPYAGFEAHS
jgi:hypothetical protein